MFYLRYIFILSLYISFIISQQKYNMTFTKRIINEKKTIFSKDGIVEGKRSGLNIIYNHYMIYNTDHPNLENHNGLYTPKGFLSQQSVLLKFPVKNFFFSIEPHLFYSKEYPISMPTKNHVFSVNNDVPLNKNHNNKYYNFRNMGIRANYFGHSLGYGNWNQWWGPGIHNSLVMSNNSIGIPHLFLDTNGYKTLIGDVKYFFKYAVSDKMFNKKNEIYFLTSYYLNIKYRNYEFGKSKHILSGGYGNDLSWEFNDAVLVHFTKNNMKYWDQIDDYYITTTFPNSGFKIYFEFGLPTVYGIPKSNYLKRNHASASIIGLRKYGLIGNNNLLLGLEYTRLKQGAHYERLPTPNWYDNIKYNYSAYNGRRWTAHSGADSDDFLVFFGYIDDEKSFIYGYNYERHGVSYHFPPEVKLESRLTASFNFRGLFIYINYENEFISHYGFVDNNQNVWNETFEPGSIQRTNTLLISIEKIILD